MSANNSQSSTKLVSGIHNSCEALGKDQIQHPSEDTQFEVYCIEVFETIPYKIIDLLQVQEAGR